MALGGTLVQDLPSEQPSEIAHRQEAPSTQGSHGVTLTAGSRLAGIAGTEQLVVNSFHHQAARDLGRGLKAVAQAEDGVIEAIESSDGFALGVQWHPECQHGEFSPKLFGAFVEACRAYAGSKGVASAV